MRKCGCMLFCVLVAVVLMLVARPVGAQSYRDERVMPEGVMGKRIDSIIGTVNSGDADRVRRFIEEECTEEFRNFAPMAEHVGVFLEVYRTTGGVDFYGVRTYEPPRPGQTVVIVKDRMLGSWRGIIVILDQAPEGRVSRLQFSPARSPSDLPPEDPLTESQFIGEVRKAVETLCDKNVFSGAILLAKGDEVVFTHVCGEASKQYHVPNNLETKFNLGSMNKMFTATAVAQLVEKGKLSYDDKISRYVDETWLPRTITDKITVQHLLTHTSGLGSYFNETYVKSSRELFRDVDDFKPLVQGDTLAFEPGARYEYSNTGMLLLGVVIESVTGGSYFDYIRKNVYQPAGMANSDSFEMDFPVENLAMGYSPAPESQYGWRSNIFQHVIKGGPAGGGFSTVGDLHRFARALEKGGLVSKESLERMWADHSGAGYGYGFGVETGSNGKVVGHSGGFDGISGNLDIYVDRGYIVSVLSNYSEGAIAISNRVGELLARVK